MSLPTGTEQTKPIGREEAGVSERHPRTKNGHRPPFLADAPGTPREIKAALDAIPPGSVTARTAGALRVGQPQRTLEDERAAFEHAVAAENAPPMET